MRVVTFTAHPHTISTIVVALVLYQIWFEVTPVSDQQTELAVLPKDREMVKLAINLYDGNAMISERQRSIP